jgi:hypothetical protein
MAVDYGKLDKIFKMLEGNIIEVLVIQQYKYLKIFNEYFFKTVTGFYYDSEYSYDCILYSFYS